MPDSTTLKLFVLLAAFGVGGRAVGEERVPVAAPAAGGTLSGIDLQYIDEATGPQDNFYQHFNGKWLATVAIPEDKASYDSFDKLYDDSMVQLRAIIEGLQSSTPAADPDQQKILDLYSSFMDEKTIAQSGLRPLDAELARVDALKSKRDLAGLMAHFNRCRISAPFTPTIDQDSKDSSKYALFIGQDGLGLPDRDYYLQDDAKMRQARTAYGAYVTSMLKRAGDKHAATEGAAIVALETQLAKVQWTQVDNRDPVKTYNKASFAELGKLAPDYDWNRYLVDSGVRQKTDYVIVQQPTYLAGFNKLIRDTPLKTWKAYFRWCLLNDLAPFLTKELVDEHFNFYGTELREIKQDLPRWKRGVRLVEKSLGEALGKMYVARHFPVESKERMDRLVQALLTAYQVDIDSLDWMGPETKAKAQAKLAKIVTKIGYPTTWRDYSALVTSKGDLIGNVIRAQTFEYNRNLNKLGRPVDRGEWSMTPQTINAYYDPSKNEIVFPAAILQPPFFDPKADSAANYGAIGAIIGHEISHGFDDQGSQFDGDGNLLGAPGWFTEADLDHFKTKTRALVDQYAAYEPVPGYHINGELTLGENIADNSGLAIAYKAYKLSLQGRAPPVLDGLTGDQRFFASWAQAWRGKTRTSEVIVELKTDPHSPDSIRGTVPEMNQAAFYAAFQIKDGDKMYIAPGSRVTLW